MQLHTFRGNTMAEALVSVKQTLGKDAAIVHTRTFRVGGVMGVGGKEIVEITAIAQSPASEPATDDRRAARHTHRATPVRDTSVPRARVIAPDKPATPSLHLVATDSTEPPASSPRSSRSIPDPVPSQMMRVRQRGAISSSLKIASESVEPLHTRVLPTCPDPAASSAASPVDHTADLQRELRDIRAMIERISTTERPPAAAPISETPAPASSPATTPNPLSAPLPPSLFEHHLRLVSQHVSKELADRIAAEIRDELSDRDLANPATVNEAILDKLASLIPISHSSITPDRPSNASSFVIALVGPTGVGKTTTIAKLAAAYKLHQGRSVALITTDTSRVGAVEQLAGYAKLLGVPFAVASSPDDIRDALSEFAAADVVLIDTAGVPAREPARALALGDLLAAANPTETHLVLSGTMSEPAMLAAARTLSPTAPNRVVFTKLDEAMTFGVLLNVATTLQTELSFVTNGQDLTGHIEAPHAERLARLVLAA